MDFPSEGSQPNQKMIQVGDRLEVEWRIDGDLYWLPGTVLKVTPKRCTIRYDPHRKVPSGFEETHLYLDGDLVEKGTYGVLPHRQPTNVTEVEIVDQTEIEDQAEIETEDELTATEVEVSDDQVTIDDEEDSGSTQGLAASSEGETSEDPEDSEEESERLGLEDDESYQSNSSNQTDSSNETDSSNQTDSSNETDSSEETTSDEEDDWTEAGDESDEMSIEEEEDETTIQRRDRRAYQRLHPRQQHEPYWNREYRPESNIQVIRPRVISASHPRQRGKLWCLKCSRFLSKDSFSVAMRRRRDGYIFCLRHSSSSGYGRRV